MVPSLQHEAIFASLDLSVLMHMGHSDGRANNLQKDTVMICM